MRSSFWGGDVNKRKQWRRRSVTLRSSPPDRVYADKPSKDERLVPGELRSAGTRACGFLGFNVRRRRTSKRPGSADYWPTARSRFARTAVYSSIGFLTSARHARPGSRRIAFVSMDHLLTRATDQAAWAALVTLVTVQVVLGIDNLFFISIVSNKLPPAQRCKPSTLASGVPSCCLLRCSARWRGSHV